MMAAATSSPTGSTLLGLPSGPPWVWIFFVAPAIQIVAHAGKILNLSDWLQQALLRWREVTHRLWTDLFGWLQISLPLDEYELDGLTLGALCLAAALSSALRRSRVSLQADTMDAYGLAPQWRLLFFAVVTAVALAYFMAFFGFSILNLYGAYEVAPGFSVRTALVVGVGLGALSLMTLLLFGRPLFNRIRVEWVLGVLLAEIGLTIVFGLAVVVSLAGMTTYLEERGLGWELYIAMVALIAGAVALVLAINWRALPAILLVAGVGVIADRVVQMLEPVARYLNSI